MLCLILLCFCVYRRWSSGAVRPWFPAHCGKAPERVHWKERESSKSAALPPAWAAAGSSDPARSASPEEGSEHRKGPAPVCMSWERSVWEFWCSLWRCGKTQKCTETVICHAVRAKKPSDPKRSVSPCLQKELVPREGGQPETRPRGGWAEEEEFFQKQE